MCFVGFVRAERGLCSTSNLASLVSDDVVGQIEAGLKCAAPHCRVLLIGFTGRTPEQPERIRTNILLVKQINVMHVTMGASGLPW